MLKVDRKWTGFLEVFFKILFCPQLRVGKFLPLYILVHFLAPGRIFPLLTFHAQYVTFIVNRKGIKNETTRCKSIL
tara:strand:- start:1295 stop:1522 length:228 start_codon:yes stop_codon:yes gene_type:complete